MQIHEIRHVGQSYRAGKSMVFNEEGKLQLGRGPLGVIQEWDAYRAEFAFDPRNKLMRQDLGINPFDINSISLSYLRNTTKGIPATTFDDADRMFINGFDGVKHLINRK